MADRKYTSDHEWVVSQGEGLVRIGITNFAQNALGDVVFVQLPAVGTQVSAGEPAGEVESTKSVSEIYAPLAGEVTAVNEELDNSPELINTDPYGDGWIFVLKIEDDAALGELLDEAAYEEYTKEA